MPVSFVFTTSNWNQPRTVTVRGVEDEDTNDETVTVTHNASRGGYGSVSGTVTVTVVDDDVLPPALVFSPNAVECRRGRHGDVPAEFGDPADRRGDSGCVLW